MSLAGAVGPALLLEPREVVDVLAGPVLLVATLVMIAVVVARAITDDRAVRRTVRVTNNAHAVGLALAVATLHLAEIEGLRAVMLAYGGLTQAAPTLVALGARRFGSGAAGGAVIATG